MTSLVEHCSPRSSFSRLPERRFFWLKTPLIAISTPALFRINHVKWREKRGFQARQSEHLHFQVIVVNVMLYVFLQFTSLSELRLCTIACFIKWILCRLIWCYRWDCYLGEMLRVSGEDRCHAIPHAPIKTPAQGWDLILIHFSC